MAAMNPDAPACGQVFLRRFTMADAPLVQSLAGDLAVADTTLRIPHPYPDGAAEEWIATHDAMFAQKSGAIFAIADHPSRILVGCIGVEISRAHNHGEIGYWIGRMYWGRGHCTAAMRNFIPYCFFELNLHRIYAHYFARNPASGRVLEKAGMKREGLFREHVLKYDKYEDIVHYGLLRSEYQPPRNL